MAKLGGGGGDWDWLNMSLTVRRPGSLATYQGRTRSLVHASLMELFYFMCYAFHNLLYAHS